MIEADTKFLVGKSLTQGLGAGGDPSMGERATEMAQGTIKEVLGDADLVFVTAGMGGGTGTGAAPICAKIAKEQGAIVVGLFVDHLAHGRPDRLAPVGVLPRIDHSLDFLDLLLRNP